VSLLSGGMVASGKGGLNCSFAVYNFTKLSLLLNNHFTIVLSIILEMSSIVPEVP